MAKYKKAVFIPAIFLIRTDITTAQMSFTNSFHLENKYMPKLSDAKNMRDVTKKINVEKYNFSADELEKLRKYRDKQNNGRLKVRFIALLMPADGNPLPKAASLLGYSIATVIRWFRMYLLKGAAGLNSFNYKPKERYLTYAQIAWLAAWVRESCPANIKIIRDYIIEHFNVVYSQDAIRKLLKKKGLRSCFKTPFYAANLLIKMLIIEI